MFNQIGIAGLGLIGGSLAKAIKKNGLTEIIVAADSDEEALIKAKSDKVIDAYSLDAEIFRGSDMVFLCMPVRKICGYLEQLARVVDGNTVITDMGSTKMEIIKKAAELGMSGHFVGGHPMTGGEKSGYEASSENLFENAYYILIPDEDNALALEKVRTVIEGIKALPVLLDAEEHDRILSMISHLPHLVAVALVNAVRNCGDDYMHTLAAGGFKDLTRIASSSPEMWEEICQSNQVNILDSIGLFCDELNGFKIKITEGNSTKPIFMEAKKYRDTFGSSKRSEIIKTYRITVDVEDRPGIIAEIATVLAKEEINISNIGINNSRETDEGILEIRFYDSESRDKSYACLLDAGYRVFKS